MTDPDDLRRLIGDSAMTTLPRSYAAAHWYGISTVSDFKAATSTGLTSAAREYPVVGH
jgi:hypothetical protein